MLKIDSPTPQDLHSLAMRTLLEVAMQSEDDKIRLEAAKTILHYQNSITSPPEKDDANTLGAGFVTSAVKLKETGKAGKA